MEKFDKKISLNQGFGVVLRDGKCRRPENAIQILDIFNKYDSLQEVYFDGQGYADKDKLENLNRYLLDLNMVEYMLKTRKTVTDIRRLVSEKNKDMDKVQALFSDLNDREKALEEIRQTQNVTIACSQATNIEVNAPGINKGSGLLRLGEMLGIRREEIME